MDSRLNLQRELETILGTRNVYFQPPESIKLSYPCIVYQRNPPDTKFANDKRYIDTNRYSLIYMYFDPDSNLCETILSSFMYISLNRIYTVDNLNHEVYDLYY